jgi:FkbM family methyltransferase
MPSENKSPIPFAEESVFDPLASERDIFYCFRLILGRLPSREEWKGHSMFIGLDLAKVVAAYLNSLEFANRRLLAPPTMDDIQLVQLDRFAMYLSSSDYAVGRGILNSKTYEPNVTRILNERVRPGMTVLDVGANIGYHSLLMSVLIGREGRCIAIEPNPWNVKLLLANKNLNRFEQLEILQAAAGNAWGVLQLNAMYSNGVVSPVNAKSIQEISQRETVLSLKIDGILPPDVRVDVIKIDVEGSEFNALSGALRCIENDHPLIISEFQPFGLRGSGVTPEEYLTFLTDLGYHLAVLESNHCVPCQQDAEMVMNIFREKNVDHIDILAEPSA